MEENKQSQELANKLWSIANDLRGTMDSSKFKDYILGAIFYRYLSERTEKYVERVLADDGISYEEALEDEEYREALEEMLMGSLHYIIYPEYLWSNMIKNIKEGKFSVKHFEKALGSIINSTLGTDSESSFDKLFDDFDLQDKDLGREVSDRTDKISKVMLKINDISFDPGNADIDILGTAYMILIGLFASDAGKKGGEFFTPTSVSKLLARLATDGLESVESVADMCAGSGSLLLEVKNAIPSHQVDHYYGQELNGSTYNLLRMNLLLHDLNPNQFTVFNDDTIKHDNFYENGSENLFTVQVSNPPYSSHHDMGKSYLDDPRYSAVGKLVPKSKADMAFVEHMVYHMDSEGQAAIVLPHGVLFRGGAEEDVRKYLIDNLNVLDAVIGLPANLFHGTGIPVTILVFKKKRNGNSDNIFFIDASKHFTKGKNQNFLEDEDLDRIVEAYKERKDIDKFSYVASLDEIRENDYNLNIPRYVDTFEEEEPVDLDEVFKSLQELESQEKEIDQELNGFFKELGLDIRL